MVVRMVTHQRNMLMDRKTSLLPQIHFEEWACHAVVFYQQMTPNSPSPFRHGHDIPAVLPRACSCLRDTILCMTWFCSQVNLKRLLKSHSVKQRVCCRYLSCFHYMLNESVAVSGKSSEPTKKKSITTVSWEYGALLSHIAVSFSDAQKCRWCFVHFVDIAYCYLLDRKCIFP